MSAQDFRVRQVSTGDFRVRHIESGYVIWQRITHKSWESLCDVYGSRADARAAIEQFCRGKILNEGRPNE